MDRSGFLQIDWRPELTFATEIALAATIKSTASIPQAQFHQRISPTINRLNAPKLGEHQTASFYTKEASILRSLLEKAQQPAQRWFSLEDQTAAAFVQAKSHKPPCPTSNFIPWRDCFGRFELPWGRIYQGVWQQDQFNGIGKLLMENGESFQGYFKNNRRHGLGVLFKQDGSRVSGIWENGELLK